MITTTIRNKKGELIDKISTKEKLDDLFDHYRSLGISKASSHNTLFDSLTHITGVKREGCIAFPYKGDNDTPVLDEGDFYVYLKKPEDEGYYPAKVFTYSCGFVINAGFKAENIFGMSTQAYLASIGSRKIKFAMMSGAKTFSNRAKVLDFLKKHKDDCKRIARGRGSLSIEPITPYFIEDYEASIDTKRKREKEDAIIEEITKELNEINGNFFPGDIPENPTFEDWNKEAVNRLKALRAPNEIIEAFRNGEVLISEGNMLKKPDLKELVLLDEMGDKITPYHIIKTPITIEGELLHTISILFVSQDSKEWIYERPDNGLVPAQVWSEATFGIPDYGTIEVKREGNILVRKQ